MREIDYHEINTGYRNLAIYLTIILIIFALMFLYLINFLYTSGDASMFNMTNTSWNNLNNSTTGFVK